MKFNLPLIIIIYLLPFALLQAQNLTITGIKFLDYNVTGMRFLLTINTSDPDPENSNSEKEACLNFKTGIHPENDEVNKEKHNNECLNCKNFKDYEAICEMPTNFRLKEEFYNLQLDIIIKNTSDTITNYTINYIEENFSEPFFDSSNNMQGLVPFTVPKLLNKTHRKFNIYFLGHYRADRIYFDQNWKNSAKCKRINSTYFENDANPKLDNRYDDDYNKLECEIDEKNTIPTGNFSLYFGKKNYLEKSKITGTYNADLIPVIILYEVILPVTCLPLYKNYNFQIKYNINPTNKIKNNIYINDINITHINLITSIQGETKSINTIPTTCKFNNEQSLLDCTTLEKSDLYFKYIPDISALFNSTERNEYILIWSDNVTIHQIDDMNDYYLVSLDQYIRKKDDKSFADDRLKFTLQFDAEYLLNQDGLNEGESPIKLQSLNHPDFIYDKLECVNSNDDYFIENYLNVKYDCFILDENKLKMDNYEIVFKGKCETNTKSGVYVFVSDNGMWMKINGWFLMGIIFVIFI